MLLYFLGGENPTFRRWLIAGGARGVGINYWTLRHRLPKVKPYLISERLPDHLSVLLDSGGLSASRADPETQDWDALLARYREFVTLNIGRLTLVSEFDCDHLPPGAVEEERESFWSGIPGKALVYWRGDLTDFERLAERYDHVAVPESRLEDARRNAHRLSAIVRSCGTRLHAAGITRPDALRQTGLRFDSASSTSWLSPARYGATVVWDGRTLRQYSRAHKDQARRKHRGLFERENFDSARIEADDHAEVTRLSVWSWLRLEESMSQARTIVRRKRALESDSRPVLRESDDTESRGGGVVTSDDGARNPSPRSRSERRLLPVFGMEAVETETEEGERGPLPVLRSRGGSMRRCDSCHLARSCPAYSPGSECVYDLPVEIRTTDQRRALISGLVEMQTQRVAFTKFAEDLEGGYPDPNLSVELDRLMGMMERAKRIEDNREFMRVSVETRGSAGILSRIFGERVGEDASQLPLQLGPAATDRLAADIIDME
jgi:hypothetical protein